MSTKVGIIAEGPIDHTLLDALLGRIAQDRAQYSWPVSSDDVAEIFQIRKRGHGGVLEVVRKLVQVLDTEHFDHAFFVILLDRNTRAVQDNIASLLTNRDRFVLAVAIEEIEAWWLGDRRNTLAWADLKDPLPDDIRYSHHRYNAERDDDPKRTLDDLTRISDRFDRYYGKGNFDLVLEFVEEYWREFARLDDVCAQCPRGYGSFEQKSTQQFRTAKSRHGWLF